MPFHAIAAIRAGHATMRMPGTRSCQDPAIEVVHCAASEGQPAAVLHVHMYTALLCSCARRPTAFRSTAAPDAPSMALTGDPMLKPVTADDYVAVGLALCYIMNDNNKLEGRAICQKKGAAC